MICITHFSNILLTISAPLSTIPGHSLLHFTCPSSSLKRASPTQTAHYPPPRLTLVLTPSRGQGVQRDLELQCRSAKQSFLMSYIGITICTISSLTQLRTNMWYIMHLYYTDHDATISQAAVLFPLPLTRPHSTSPSQALDVINNDSSNTEICINPLYHGSTSTTTSASSLSDTCLSYNTTHIDSLISTHNNTYPYLLSLHGTGLSPLSQADAYKCMLDGHTEYTFGVEGMFVIAPGRFGAHNWEAVGDYSARESVRAVRRLLARVLGLPQLSNLPGIVAGHSMVRVYVCCRWLYCIVY